MSPENTMVLTSPFSSAVTVMLAEPSRWPASVKTAFTPGQTSTSCSYSQVRSTSITAMASSVV